MAHLIEQLYVDEIDFEEITSVKLIDLVFTEFVHRQICELEELRRCSNEADPLSTNDCETINDGDLWLMHTDEAISMIDCEDVWHGIIEACKILKYPEPSSEHRSYLESLYGVPWFTLKTIYFEFERTHSFIYLMDYTSCVCKLRYH
jgi:hypothetical protein